MSVATAAAQPRQRIAEVPARRTLDGTALLLSVSGEEVHDAIADHVTQMVRASSDCLAQAPPDLAQDVLVHGLHVVGGGSLSTGSSSASRRPPTCRSTVRRARRGGRAGCGALPRGPGQARAALRLRRALTTRAPAPRPSRAAPRPTWRTCQSRSASASRSASSTPGPSNAASATTARRRTAGLSCSAPSTASSPLGRTDRAEGRDRPPRGTWRRSCVPRDGAERGDGAPLRQARRARRPPRRPRARRRRRAESTSAASTRRLDEASAPRARTARRRTSAEGSQSALTRSATDRTAEPIRRGHRARAQLGLVARERIDGERRGADAVPGKHDPAGLHGYGVGIVVHPPSEAPRRRLAASIVLAMVVLVAVGILIAALVKVNVYAITPGLLPARRPADHRRGPSARRDETIDPAHRRLPDPALGAAVARRHHPSGARAARERHRADRSGRADVGARGAGLPRDVRLAERREGRGDARARPACCGHAGRGRRCCDRRGVDRARDAARRGPDHRCARTGRVRGVCSLVAALHGAVPGERVDASRRAGDDLGVRDDHVLRAGNVSG